MGSNLDDAKGRAKKAAGELTDDEEMKREGKMDQAGAQVKDKAEQAKDKIGDTVDNLKDKFNR